MELPENCPKCSARRIPPECEQGKMMADYECGTYAGYLNDQLQVKQSKDCHVRELQAAILELHDRIHDLEVEVNKAESESNRRGRVIAQYEEEHRKTRS